MTKKTDWEWCKEHSDKSGVHIECSYQACEYKEIKFPEILMGRPVGDPMYWCLHPGNGGAKNMTYWCGLNAPKWCMKRKANGGNDK